jgi:hypothetical protein
MPTTTSPRRRRQWITWSLLGALYAASILCSFGALQPVLDTVAPSPAMVAGELAQQQQQQGSTVGH